ncbi:hypothetical protein EOL73_00570 [Candidatus Saccharibacteria bacterium]|nr:hypothetical protein [Candidatus Saccharibacteria bacterium]NCU40236.1 hypothetical protein [Candidatus Saccharibacteria bacterium]
MEPQTPPTARIYSIGLSGVLRPFLIGIGVGMLGWLLTLFFKNVVVASLFCRSADTFSLCSSGGTIAWDIAYIILALVSVFVLMRTNMHRPLLVVVAAVAALWGIGAWLMPMFWWQGMLWSGLLFGLAYALFSWLASHTIFVVSLVSSIVAVVVIHLISAI